MNRMGGVSVRCLALVALALMPAAVAGAQLAQQPIQAETRLDAIFSRSSAVQAGFGLSVPAGIYVRTGVVAGIGASRHGADGRLDLLARFSLDPFRQSTWAPYAGAGVSGRFRPDKAGGTRGYLLVLLGLEGGLPAGAREGIVPAFEVGLGGGARVGVVLRRGIVRRR